MTTMTKTEKKELIWTSKEKETHKSEYGCEILIENGTLEQVTVTNAPTDAFVITYEYQEKVCRDLTRGVRVKLFDMYYDKFKARLLTMVRVQSNQTFGVIILHPKRKSGSSFKNIAKKSPQNFWTLKIF